MLDVIRAFKEVAQVNEMRVLQDSFQTVNKNSRRPLEQEEVMLPLNDDFFKSQSMSFSFSGRAAVIKPSRGLLRVCFLSFCSRDWLFKRVLTFCCDCCYTGIISCFWRNVCKNFRRFEKLFKSKWTRINQ